MASNGMQSPRSARHSGPRRRLLQGGTSALLLLALGAHPTGLRAEPETFDAHIGLDPGHSRVDVGAAGAGVGELRPRWMWRFV